MQGPGQGRVQQPGDHAAVHPPRWSLVLQPQAQRPFNAVLVFLQPLHLGGNGIGRSTHRVVIHHVEDILGGGRAGEQLAIGRPGITTIRLPHRCHQRFQLIGPATQSINIPLGPDQPLRQGLHGRTDTPTLNKIRRHRFVVVGLLQLERAEGFIRHRTPIDN